MTSKIILAFFFTNLCLNPTLHEGMIMIKGGYTTIGSNHGRSNEKPSFSYQVKPFWLDAKAITVREFRLFIKISHYVTDAEKYGEAWVWDKTQEKWKMVRGANWKYPEGKDKKKAKNSDPVTQISWQDAKAYASWVKKRLPTEFEWEFACQYAKQYNLQDMKGNLWQWCANWFEPYEHNNYYRKIKKHKSIKGGQHEMNGAFIEKFTPSIRSKLNIRQASFNLGFRCAKDF